MADAATTPFVVPHEALRRSCDAFARSFSNSEELPAGTPHLYEGETRVYAAGELVDVVCTSFGIRELRFDPDAGIHVNGQPVRIQGVNQRHDLGALGSAFNLRARFSPRTRTGCAGVPCVNHRPVS